MRYWVSVYITVASPRKTTETLMRRPKCSSVTYRRIHEYTATLKVADHRYNIDSARTLVAYTTRQAAILQALAQENDDNEEENEEEDNMQEEGDDNADDVEKEEDEMEDDMEKEEDMNDSITDNNKDKNHSKLDDYLDKLNEYVNKRFLTGAIPRPEDIDILNRTSLS